MDFYIWNLTAFGVSEKSWLWKKDENKTYFLFFSMLYTILSYYSPHHRIPINLLCRILLPTLFKLFVFTFDHLQIVNACEDSYTLFAQKVN